MAEYLAPGVYVEELPAPQTIEGVSTSTAGFVGAALRGPTVGPPQLVTSFADFRRRYGGHLDESWGAARHLASAVDAFFANGGQRVYVSRVVGAGAAAAARTFRDGWNAVLLEDTSTTRAERDRVRLSTLRGVDAGSHVRFSEQVAGNLEVETRRVMRYDAGTGTVWLDTPLRLRFTAAKCAVTLEGAHAPGDPGAEPSLRVEATSEGRWGNALRVTVAVTTGATALAAAAAVEAETALEPVALGFATDGPEAGAVSVALADAGDLVAGETVVAFANVAGDIEERAVTGVDGDEISWDRPLVHDYSGVGATVSRLSAVLAPGDAVPLELAGAGPAQGAETAVLTDVSGVVAGDVLELRDPDAPATERVVVTGVDEDDREVAWSGGLDGDFTGAAVTLRHLPSPRVPVTAAAGFSAGDLVRVRQPGATQVVRILGVDGDALRVDAATTPLRDRFDAGATVALAHAGRADGSGVDLSSTNNFYEGAVVEIDDGSQKTYHRVERINGNTLTMTANLGRAVPDGATARIVDLLLLVDDGERTERFEHLSMQPGTDAYAPRVVNLGSRLVRVTDQGSTSAPPLHLPQIDWGERNAADPADPRRLAGGADGAPPTAAAVIGTDLGPGQRSGILALADVDAIAIIAAPGRSESTVHGALLGQCEDRKDRFAVIDPAPGSVLGSGGPDDIVVQRNAHDSLYGALYYPWLVAPDPLDPENTAGVLVPPSGHVTGVYARVDTERGVHKAPANEVVRGIIGLESKLTEREQAVLNPINVNVIRDFRDVQRGIRVWGARCITSDSAWRYVPVRRLFVFLESSLYEGLQWVVFEPNAEPLWARVRRTVAGFLRRVWLGGALEGVTEDEAFFVKCDRSTMTPDDIANGRLIVVVGAAPVRPAEFVIIRVSQLTREAAD